MGHAVRTNGHRQTMKLGEKQHLFAQLLPNLLVFVNELAAENGWSVRLGDLFRDSRAHGEYGEKVGYAASKSNHKLKIAIDINIVVNNDLPASAHDKIGKFWKSLHPLCEWGGEPGRHDANHYSLNHDGRW
jgi:hypothetical protein